ncbi:hypothetical protein QAD02_022958 [Eretmocerus hayati]|uniref:Uncharacterized protein n=1 Tax=Eretmocerus hayati TaxID=131215 RepID=A0ACC2PV38_9HYME|nr:hypothetical protein QAD02_022958 [Eretmocerus hayati]
MATCLKRATKPLLLDAPAGRPQLRELICPVCHGLLREPVSLPCEHNLCLRCLRGTVQHSSLSCPLCRQRLSSWLRRNGNAPEYLVNAELWQLIRTNFPRELELAAQADQLAAAAVAAGSSNSASIVVDLEPEVDPPPKKVISAAGEIKAEFEVQLQLAEAEKRRQQEKERVASEALIQKIQEEEERQKSQKLVQFAQDQLLAKNLAKQEVIAKTSKYDSHNRALAVNLDGSKPSVVQTKSLINQKMSDKLKNVTDARKQSLAFMPKTRSEKLMANIKSCATNAQKGPSETSCPQKPVPIHNAVNRVVTHLNRPNPLNNLVFPAAQGELMKCSSKIYGLQSKEELLVPSDILSSKKKKLGVEVCITTVEGEDRIGSAESAGSHDSINQEIHHFKPIKACPRTPLKVSDGKQIDPKLIRVLPLLKKSSNSVPKPPTPTHSKKVFGCSWSAFKRISRQQQVLYKSSNKSHQEMKKTDNKKPDFVEYSPFAKSANIPAFDSNKNYTKNVNKVINGTKVSKKLNLDQIDCGKSNTKVMKRGKPKNGLVLGKHKKMIEVVEIEDDDSPQLEITTKSGSKAKASKVAAAQSNTPDPLSLTPKHDVYRPPSSLELAVENIAERIKRRKTSRTTSNTENLQSAMNSVAPVQRLPKPKSKRPSPKQSKTKQKTKKATSGAKPTKKVVVETTVTSQIKKLAARSSKRPRYTEDSESEDESNKQPSEEPSEYKQQKDGVSEEQRKLEANEVAELDRSATEMCTPSPPKRSRKASKPTKRTKKPEEHMESEELDEAAIIEEQQRLERLAAQEREDLEIAKLLQARFEAMERVAGRTRRGAAARVPSPLLIGEILQEKKPQKRPAPIN